MIWQRHEVTRIRGILSTSLERLRPRASSPVSNRLYDGDVALTLLPSDIKGMRRSLADSREANFWLGQSGCDWLSKSKITATKYAQWQSRIQSHTRYNPWEFSYGLAGLTVIGRSHDLERAVRKSMNLIYENADLSNGIIWYHKNDWQRQLQRSLSSVMRLQRTDSIITLGMAHGQAGVLATAVQNSRHFRWRDFDGHIAEQALTLRGLVTATSKFSPLLIKCANGLKTVRQVHPPGWCNGPVGIAFSLANAGEHLAHTSLTRFAKKYLRENLPRLGPDATLCHGSAGLGLTALRIHELTGSRDAADLARRCFSHSLNRITRSTNRLDSGLVTGDLGIWLALAASLPQGERRVMKVLGLE